MANRYQRKDRAEMEIDRKKRKIRAAQIVVKELRTKKDVPKTWSQSIDVANYMAEAPKGRVPKRDMMGNIIERRRGGK